MKLKKQDIIFFSFLGLVVISSVIFYFVSKKKKTPKKEINEEKTTKPLPPKSEKEIILKEGSKGEKVVELQRALIRWKNKNSSKLKAENSPVMTSKINADGIFGPITARACRAALGTDVVTTSIFNKFVVNN